MKEWRWREGKGRRTSGSRVVKKEKEGDGNIKMKVKGRAAGTRETMTRGRDELGKRDHVERRTWRRGGREGGLTQFVFGGRGSVMADICTAHGHLRWFIYPRLPDQASDLPEFVRLEGGPYHTTQFLTFHISSHFQLPVSLYHST